MARIVVQLVRFREKIEHLIGKPNKWNKHVSCDIQDNAFQTQCLSLWNWPPRFSPRWVDKGFEIAGFVPESEPVADFIANGAYLTAVPANRKSLTSNSTECTDPNCFNRKLDQFVARQVEASPKLVQISTAWGIPQNENVLGRGRYILIAPASERKNGKQPARGQSNCGAGWLRHKSHVATKHSETCFDIRGRAASPQEPRRPKHRQGEREARRTAR